MAHLLAFIDTRSQFARPKSALLVENDESLLNFLRTSLKNEGYAVRTAANSEEGLRLYRDFAPFNVVLIDYYVPPKDGTKIDPCAPQQTNGTALAMAIHDLNPSQKMIIAAFDCPNAGQVPRPPQLMHIPLLIDSSNFQLPRLLEKIEVERAIEALTPSELLRLERFADYRVQGLGRAACGRTGEDLLSEARLRTLIGAGATRQGRHWNKHVDFVWHLTGAMRSISSCWRRQFEAAVQRKETEAYLIPALPILDAEGQEQSPLDNKASWDTAADQRLIEKERILTIFKDDAEATQVLRGIWDDLKKNEIMLRYVLNEKKYAAAMKRIRVKLQGRGNGGSGSD
jgi:CheY-like chemotaxis protein